jgi:hypothetical protein
MATPEQLADESRRARKVRQLVDIASSLIMQSNMTRREAETLVAHVREQILGLFPDGASTYELVYAPRFKRLIDEFTGTPRSAMVLRFPQRVS